MGWTATTAATASTAATTAPPAGVKRRMIREGGSASRVSINARPQDTGGGTGSPVPRRRIVTHDVILSVEQPREEPTLVSHTSSTVQTGQALAENRPLQGCSHDVVGLCAHKGTMCNTNDRVLRKLIKSQYEGGVLVLKHANPVGWYAVVQKRFLGLAGPKVKEPLALWVLIHADHAGQRTAIHRATGFWEPELDPTINRNLDSRPMVGTTYLERPAPAVYLDSWPMEAKVRRKNLEWKPMKISVINCKLDSQAMVGTTYLERPALAVYLDSWPMEAKVRSKQREWKPVIFPPDSYTLNSQPMVGTTYLERPAPAAYLDSWLMKGGVVSATSR